MLIHVVEECAAMAIAQIFNNEKVQIYIKYFEKM
jgi:hypothetical protein